MSRTHGSGLGYLTRRTISCIAYAHQRKAQHRCLIQSKKPAVYPKTNFCASFSPSRARFDPYLSKILPNHGFFSIYPQFLPIYPQFCKTGA
jgi:hypothetical protein